jgi:hypothetical protein
MPRKEITPTGPHDDVNTDALAQGQDALITVATNATKVAEMIGYSLSYNRERVVQEARFFMGEAAGAMLEAGKRLVLLKENEAHGEFSRIVTEELGLALRTAQQMMQAAIKYQLSAPELASNAQTFARLGKSKMFELMTLDTDSLVELSEGGTVAGITLDEVDQMSVRELKAALRDAQEDAKAKDSLLASKSQVIDKLQTKQAKVAPPTPDEEAAQLRRETTDWAFQAEAIVRGSIRDGLKQLSQNAEVTGTHHDEFAAGLLAQLQRAIAEVRSEFGLKAAPDGDPTPEWEKDGN